MCRCVWVYMFGCGDCTLWGALWCNPCITSQCLLLAVLSGVVFVVFVVYYWLWQQTGVWGAAEACWVGLLMVIALPGVSEAC